MKCLITGGNGFIGSHLVDKLIKERNKVIVIDNLSAECNEKFYFNDKAENHKLDICDAESIDPLFDGVDYVFHLAAESRIQPAILNPSLAASVNVVGTTNVLQSARKHNVKRVIYSATSSGYGLKNKPPLKETMQNDCLNPYSVTKCAGEEMCKMYSTLFGLETVILRYFNVYGERSPLKGHYAPVIGLFLKQHFSQKKMTIVGDGLQKRDFTHVQDVVEANLLAAAAISGVSGELFNVGSGTNISILDIAKHISEDFIFIDERPGEARETLADITKIKNNLGWHPSIDVLDWVSAVLSGDENY